MNAKRLHLMATVLSLVTACAITASPAMAATPAKEAAHNHAAAMPSKLSFDQQGRRWATDPALREGMGRIRGLVETQLDNAHRGKLTAAQYTVLAGQIETEVGGIVANCKLDPKADAMLHLVIGDLAAGTEAMAGKTAKVKPQQGLVQAAAAVNNYGRYFDHPGFKPINMGH